MGKLKTLRIPRAQMIGEGYSHHYSLSPRLEFSFSYFSFSKVESYRVLHIKHLHFYNPFTFSFGTTSQFFSSALLILPYKPVTSLPNFHSATICCVPNFSSCTKIPLLYFFSWPFKDIFPALPVPRLHSSL